ncbi:hypothetical protein [Kingella oralis]|nr:hypothetical protein [Kingella oralis]
MLIHLSHYAITENVGHQCPTYGFAAMLAVDGGKPLSRHFDFQAASEIL